MHKILLAILLFVILFFPNSEVFAIIPACDNTRTDLEVVGSIVTNTADCPDGTCYKITGREVSCYKVKAAPAPGAPGAPGAPPAAAVAPTSGSGQRCWLKGGQPFTLLPGQPIAIDTDTGKAHETGIYTAIGCIPTEPKALVEGLLKFATLAAGGIAFLLMILGALGMITAEGNPEAIKNSQERFYSAIIGLLLIIFSVLLMQVIGVDILGLPEFGK